MTEREAVLLGLTGGLVVSCQPVPKSPFDTVDGVVAFARAAEAAGARGLRIEGVANVAAVVRACRLPVIGLVKRDLAGTEVRITPLLQDVADLAAAGAPIIAVDATIRGRPVPAAALLAAIRAQGLVAMADCATREDARAALAAGADCVGSTLSGYTGGPVPTLPDLALIRDLAALGVPVLAEGRFNTPALAAAAMRAGAAAVVVGSAITRPEHVTGWFRDAVAAAARPAQPVLAPMLAFDIGGSKTLAALVQDGAILERRLRPTERAVGAEGWIAGLARMAEDWFGRYAAAALAVTGVIAADGGWSALNPDVLDIPAGFALGDRVAAALGVPAIAVNDAQAAAWGEYRYGAGEGRDLVFVTVSSGVGGGVVASGRLLRGAAGLAGSLGQVLRAPAGTGKRLEARASGFAMKAAAHAIGRQADAPAIFAAARDGEAWAERILQDAAESLAETLFALQAIVDPERVALGGGVGLADGFLDRVRAALAAYPAELRPVLVPAKLGAEAGLIGAADLALTPLA